MELNRIYNENCLDTMARMPDGFVDLTVTSPPYDNLRTYNGYEFDFEPIARELYRVTKKGGVVVWVVGDATINGSETGTSFRQALYFKEIGLNDGTTAKAAHQLKR
jgi:DNA modification methylase